MQLLVSDPSYDHEGVDRARFLDDLKAQLRSISSDVQLRDGDIGQGASDPVIIAVVALAIFQSGKKIDENIDAWVGVAGKFAKLMKWIVERGLRRRVDEDGASLIAVRAILEQTDEPIRTMTRSSSVYIPFWRNSKAEESCIDSSPDGLFSQTYVINHSRVFVLVIRSTGSLESLSSYPILNWHDSV